MIRFREATAEDDARLTQLVAKPMPGDLSLAMTREPSLLDACRRHGPRRRVLTAVDGEDIVAVCTYFPWLYQIRGEARRVWTVADFRAEKQAAGRSVTGLGWQALRQRLNGEPAVISLVHDNPVSLRLFSKQRKGWPRLSKVGQLETLILPLALVPREKDRGGLVQPSARQIARLMKERPSHLEPLIAEDDVGDVTPGVESFLACHDGSRLSACGALWDPSDCRQVKVSGYSGLYARLRAACRRLRLPLLPDPGHQVKLRFASFLRGGCEVSRRRILGALIGRAKDSGAHFLVLGQDAGQVLPFPRYWPRFTVRSSLYQLCWEGDSELGFGSTGYEVAWL